MRKENSQKSPSKAQLILQDNREALNGVPLKERLKGDTLKKLAIVGAILAPVIALALLSAQKDQEATHLTEKPPLVAEYNIAIYGKPNGPTGNWEEVTYPTHEKITKTIVHRLTLIKETQDILEKKAQSIEKLNRLGITVPENTKDVREQSKGLGTRSQSTEEIQNIKEMAGKDLRDLEGIRQNIHEKTREPLSKLLESFEKGDEKQELSSIAKEAFQTLQFLRESGSALPECPIHSIAALLAPNFLPEPPKPFKGKEKNDPGIEMA